MPTTGEPSPNPRFRRLLLAVELPAASGVPEARALALAAELHASVVVVSVLESSAHLPVTTRRVDQLREVHEREAELPEGRVRSPKSLVPPEVGQPGIDPHSGAGRDEERVGSPDRFACAVNDERVHGPKVKSKPACARLVRLARA